MIVHLFVNMFLGEPNGRLFRRSIDTLLRDKEMLVADLIQRASDCMKEDILDRRASTPPTVYARTLSLDIPDNEDEEKTEEINNTVLFKRNEKENELMNRDENGDENENEIDDKNENENLKITNSA